MMRSSNNNNNNNAVQKQDDPNPSILPNYEEQFDSTMFWESDDSISDEEEEKRIKIQLKLRENKSRVSSSSEDESNNELGSSAGPVTALVEYPISHLEHPKLKPHADTRNKIFIKQDTRKCCGGKIWEAADMLCDYLLDTPEEFIAGKRIIELGAGTGIVGILAAMMGAKEVVLTDIDAMIPLLVENIKLNGVEANAHAKVLYWGSNCYDEFKPPVDMIFASDCVYHEVGFVPLITTLWDLSDANTVTLLAFKKRWRSSKRFFNMAKKKFVVEEVKSMSERVVEKYRNQNIHIYKMTKKTTKTAAAGAGQQQQQQQQQNNNNKNKKKNKKQQANNYENNNSSNNSNSNSEHDVTNNDAPAAAAATTTTTITTTTTAAIQ